MPTLVAGNNEVPTVINTPVIPKEGPRDLPLLFDFSVTSSYLLDLQQQIQNNQFSRAQTIFVDNSANSSPVSITWTGTGQILQIPGNSQAYLPVLTTQRPMAVVASAGTGKCYVHILNVPISPAVWGATAGAPSYTPSGALLVSDAALDSVTTTNGVEVIERVVGSGDVVYNRFKSQNAINGVVQAGVASLLVGNPSLFVNFIDVMLSGDASLGTLHVSATTYDPAKLTNPALLSNGNLSVNCVTGNSPCGVISSLTETTGKFYFESTIVYTNSTQISNTGSGLANLSQPNNTHINQPFAAGVRFVDGVILVAGASHGSTGGTFSTTDVAGIAIDFGAKLFWARNGAGNWNGNATNDPSTGVGGVDFSTITVGTGYGAAAFVGSVNPPAGSTVTTNFGASAFANAAPSGFNDLGATSGGSQGVTIAITEGAHTIGLGYAFVGAVETTSTVGPSANVQLIKLDQLNYDAKTAATTLGMSVIAGGVAVTLATGNIIYNIGAGTTSTVN